MRPKDRGGSLQEPEIKETHTGDLKEKGWLQEDITEEKNMEENRGFSEGRQEAAGGLNDWREGG